MVVQGVRKICVIIEWQPMGLIISKHPPFNFFENLAGYPEKPNQDLIYDTSNLLFEFLLVKTAENAKSRNSFIFILLRM